jgi:hypothetical protein
MIYLYHKVGRNASGSSKRGGKGIELPILRIIGGYSPTSKSFVKGHDFSRAALPQKALGL